MSDTVEILKEKSKSNANINGIFVVSKIEAKPFKNKLGFFLQCDLTDKTGTVKGVVWDHADIMKECLKNKIVYQITGEATRYNDNPQIVIKSAVKADKYNPGDFMVSLSPEAIKGHLDHLTEVAKTINNQTCKFLWGYITNGSVYAERFVICPGGVGDVIHHAYLGGLLEHTSSMITIADDFCKWNKTLDRDIVLTGCLIHDVGKIYTYDWSTVIEMTDRGRLLHHTTIGYDIISDILKDKDPQLSLHLLHIIISHHQEEGIRKPMTAEAETVAQIDRMDATIKQVNQYVSDPANITEGNWSKFCQLSGRQYFVPRSVSDTLEVPKQETKMFVEEKLF